MFPTIPQGLHDRLLENPDAVNSEPFLLLFLFVVLDILSSSELICLGTDPRPCEISRR